MIASQIVVHVTNTETSAALVLAVVGVVLGAGSLIWQISSRVLERPRLKITLKRAWTDPAGTEMMKASFSDHSGIEKQMVAQGFTVPYLAVEVQNVGRFAVGVRGVEAITEDGLSFQETGSSLDPKPESRIDPFAFDTWFVRMQAIQAMVDTSASVRSGWNRSQKIRMKVEPAFGKPIVTKQFLTVTPKSVKPSVASP